MGPVQDAAVLAPPFSRSLELRRRRERKYLIGPGQQRLLAQALLSFASPDVHGDPAGHYLVTSLYYDNPEHDAYWARANAQTERRKLRIRGYSRVPGPDFDRVMVEIKRREGPYVTKDRLALPLMDAEALCRGEQPPAGLDDPEVEIAERVSTLVRTWGLKPVCRVTYWRQAFTVGAHAVGMRVTFDHAIRGRVTALGLGEDGVDHRLLPPEVFLMEVKTRAGVPEWWTSLLRQVGLGAGPFSKYSTALQDGLARVRTLWFEQEDLHG
jgi:hypothetical protein